MKLSELPESITVDNSCPATEEIRVAWDKLGGGGRIAQICGESSIDAATCLLRLRQAFEKCPFLLHE